MLQTLGAQGLHRNVQTKPGKTWIYGVWHPSKGLLRGPSTVSDFSVVEVLALLQVERFGPRGPLRRRQASLACTPAVLWLMVQSAERREKIYIKRLRASCLSGDRGRSSDTHPTRRPPATILQHSAAVSRGMAPTQPISGCSRC